ncbi:MAG: lipoprotein signal peptidase [Chitinophagales bacterium]
MKVQRNVILIVLAVLLLDQGLKLWVRTHLIENQELFITSWFRLHFVENPGMAFSMELPGQYGKLLLSWFRVFAITGIGYMLMRVIREKQPAGLAYCGALIFAGAVGNLIDSAFYGIAFHYAPFMQGYVVDMLWFPIVHGFFPTWLPLWGGEYFEFFRPVFNVADSSITVGIFLIVIFQNRLFPEQKNEAAIPEEIQPETPASEN